MWKTTKDGTYTDAHVCVESILAAVAGALSGEVAAATPQPFKGVELRRTGKLRVGAGSMSAERWY